MTPDEPSETEAGIAGGDVLEAGIMIVSALLFVGLLGYIASQAIVAPTAAQPTATIDAVDRSPAESQRPGSRRVTVQLENDGETGLSSVEVVVR